MSSSVSTEIRILVWVLVAGLCVLVGALALADPGGFLESDGTLPNRARYTSGDIAAFMPTTRGTFTFPAPYNTQAIRLTDATDCPTNQDCVWDVGYSYWNNINAHQNDATTMYVFVGMENTKGGGGVTIFSIDKSTLAITKVGALFGGADPLRQQRGEGWYFSSNPSNPTRLYLGQLSSTLGGGTVLPATNFQYIDILSKSLTTVFSVTTQFGANRAVCQMHSSVNDNVHVGTLIDTTAGHTCGGTVVAADRLGCAVYVVSANAAHFYPKIAGKDFNECTIDKSGRFAVSLEDSGGGANPTYNRFFTISDDSEYRVTGGSSVGSPATLGHMDTGYGYALGADNTNALPNASVLWYLNPPNLGPLIHYNNGGSGGGTGWEIVAFNHVAHSNAVPNRDLTRQYACGSDASTYTSIQNEILCIPIDGTMTQLIVAPVMADLTTGGGLDSYRRQPKGNVDPTGEWFIWTANRAGSSRLDAFLVRVPKQTLYPQASGF